MDLHEIARQLSHVKWQGDTFVARCPAHEDRTPSLSGKSGNDGRTLLKCHAGCKTEDVLSEIGLSFRDLYPTPLTATTPTLRSSPSTPTTYDYRDESGTLLYQKVRLQPKSFRLRRPDGQDGWIYNLDGTCRVLYRLNELQDRKAVVLCEGEKDADRLWSLGIPATTTRDGAKTQPGKNWRAEYTEQLVAAHVARVAATPDHDEAGRVYATDAAAACHAAGITAKVVECPDVPPKGDVSDWLDAGHTKEEFIALLRAAPVYDPDVAGDADDVSDRVNDQARRQRQVILTAASAILVRPVRWLWENRLALGTLALLGGREGVGKTICAYTLSADITRGTLPGDYLGTPRAVIVAATEDSWGHTIVPRLMAAGADLDLVYRVDVTSIEGTDTTLSLPCDLAALEQVVRKVRAGLIILDPLISRLDATLDSHKDAEVRLALEPLVKLAEAADALVLGLIHVNKSVSSDPLTLLMGSRAFAAVARAVLFVLVDPDDESVRLLGQPKNNLGRMDLPTLQFRIVGEKVADTAEGPVWTGKLEWLGESDRSIREAVEASTGDRTATGEAADWLEDYLTSVDGTQDSQIVQEDGRRAGHSKNALYRAKDKLRITSDTSGFPRKARWSLPPVVPSSGGAPTTGTTGSTGNSGNTDAPVDPVVPVVPVDAPPQRTGTTGETDDTSAERGSTYREF
jgi:hypothetical protein